MPLLVSITTSISSLNYQYYANFIHDLLLVEKHYELTIKNHHQHCVGVVSLPEIHHNEQNEHKSNFSKDKNPKKIGKSTKH
jgi:hypothetical protein